MVSGLFGAEYHEKLLSVDDLINFLPKMVHLQDEPLADPVCVPLYYVSELAKKNNVTVCQVGEGADELFIGYPSFLKSMKIDSFLKKFPYQLKNKAYEVLLNSKFKHSAKTEFLRRHLLGQPTFWSGAEYHSDSEKKNLLSD